MKNNITEVVFILDASGSMYDLTKDTVGGFNSMISEQKEKDGTVLVSTVTFNNASNVIHDRLDIREVPEMTEKDYRAWGSTALIDAMGDAIKHISCVHKYIRREDVPEHTLFIITTDGYENASHKYTAAEVRKMVENKKALGWEFLFLGANIDAVETAKFYGIDEDRAVQYRSDGEGTRRNFRAMGRAMCMASTGSISAEWKDEIERDTEENI